jgi:hypothetical protein
VLTLAFTSARAASTLADELERLRLEVWLALTVAFTRMRELSTLDEEFESERLEV